MDIRDRPSWPRARAGKSGGALRRSMSAASAAWQARLRLQRRNNLVIAGTLSAFCAAAYTYTASAVGRDDLDVALAKREAARAAAPPPPPPPPPPPKKRFYFF